MDTRIFASSRWLSLRFSQAPGSLLCSPPTRLPPLQSWSLPRRHTPAWPLALGPGAGEQTGCGMTHPGSPQEPAGSASWFPGISGRLTGQGSSVGTMRWGLTEVTQEPPHFPGRALYSWGWRLCEAPGEFRGALRGVTESTGPPLPLTHPYKMLSSRSSLLC